MDQQKIRDKAESILNKKYTIQGLTETSDLYHILHELHVHQIELEIQNEELRRTQESLLTARRQYFNLYNFAPVAYLTLNAQGIIRNVNVHSANMLGEEQRLLVGRPLLPHIHPDDYAHFFEYLAKVLKSEEHVQTELVLANGDRSVSVDAVCSHSDSQEPLCWVVMTDITHLRQTEQALHFEKEQLAITLRSIGDGVIVTDENDMIKMINPPALQLLHTECHQFQRIPLAKHFVILDEESDELLLPSILTSIHAGDVVQPMMTKLQTGVETETIVELSAAPIIDGQTLHGGVWVFRDQTEKRKQQAEQIRAAHLDALGLLAGGIAHDFNNLLTGIFGNIELAKLVLPAEQKAHKFLDVAMLSMERAINLTQQLSTFAKGGDPIKELVNINQVITETAFFSVRGSNVRLDCQIPPDLFAVEADKGQLSQIISNLVINAQQAMPDGGVIRIMAQNICSSKGSFIQIIVQDRGIGIKPQDLDKIFTPYFTTKEGGTGMGLAITHSIVQKHNGSISVDSMLGEGTTFTIYLPAVEASAERESKSTEQVIPSTMQPARILVLDDEEAVRNVIGKMLTVLGHSATFATDGNEVVAEYQSAFCDANTYDVVILDLTIAGGMSGTDASKKILQIDPHAKLIVSSGYATDPVMANYARYGFASRLVKPYRLSELKERIHQTLTHDSADERLLGIH